MHINLLNGVYSMGVQANPRTSAVFTADSLQSESSSLDFTQQKKRKILVAQWVMVDGKLICQWIIE
jgi:hypothetical protein